MNLQDAIKFATEHPMACMATMDGNQPRTRYLMLDQADETGFYFTVVKTKEVYRQLREHPQVEICFLNQAADFGTMVQMRATGIAEESDNPVVLQKAIQARAGLAQMLGMPVSAMAEMAGLFRIHTGEIWFWTPMDIGHEQQVERIKY